MDSAMLADLRGQLAHALDLVDQLLAAARCTDCGRSGRQLQPWRDGGQVVAWLGPTCWRRRADASHTPAPLPIADQERNQPHG